MAYHDLFSSGAVQISQFNQSGSFAPGVTDLGTGAPIYAGNHAYHAVCFIGTAAGGAAAVGSLVVYAATASTGDGTTVLGSVALTRGTGAQVFDLKADTLTNSGTAYTHISAQLIVATGSVDVRGAAFVFSYHPRTAGTTPAAAGIRSLGTLYY